MVSDFMTISAFSRRSMLSLKALRLYEQQGLICPMQVDPETGYRLYHESQLKLARTVSLLRRLDMPLNEIAMALESESPGSALAEWWGRQEEVMAVRREILHFVLVGLDEAYAPPGFDVRLRNEPQRCYLVTQKEVASHELSTWLGATFGALQARATEIGGISGHSMAVYHGEVSHDSNGPVEVCVPMSTEVEANDGNSIRTEPEHLLAYTNVRKAQVGFPQILRAYNAVHAWIMANGYTQVGASREIYLGDFVAAGPQDIVVEVAIPVEVQDEKGA